MMMASDYDLELEATACRSKPAVDDKDGQFEGSMQCSQLLESQKSIIVTICLTITLSS